MQQQTEYWEEFKEFSDRKLTRQKKHKLNMEELQSKRLHAMPLDVTTDAPLPKWAMSLVCTSQLSKRTKLLLLQYHNSKINSYRMGIATATEPQRINEASEEDFCDED